MVKLRLTKLDGTVVEKWVEKPRYGGWLSFARAGQCSSGIRKQPDFLAMRVCL